MATDYAAERRAAGRSVPADIELATAAPAAEAVWSVPPYEDHRSARSHDLAHHRRLRRHGARRHRRHRRARVLARAAAHARSAASSTTSTACSAGSDSAPRSSASVTSAPSVSTRRRRTTRGWPTKCWHCCRAISTKDGVVAVGEIGFDDQTDAEEAVLRAADRAGARVQPAGARAHAASRQEAGHHSIDCAGEVAAGSPKSGCSSITTTRRRCRIVLESGCWAGHTHLPQHEDGRARAWPRSSRSTAAAASSSTAPPTGASAIR